MMTQVPTPSFVADDYQRLAATAQQSLVAHRLLDQWELVEPSAAEDRPQPNARGRDATLATSSLQCGSQLRPSQTRRLGRRRRNR